VINLLESELAHPVYVCEHEPVRVVGRLVRGRFITGSVPKPEELSIELGEFSRSGGIESSVQQLGVFSHEASSG
jgi:hypothetical protein